MNHLIAADEQEASIRRGLRFLIDPKPPPEGNSSVDQHVDQSQHEPSLPAQRECEQQGVDPGVNPSRRVRQVHFVDCHPFILEKPIRNEVQHQGGFENGHRRGFNRRVVSQ